MRLLTSLIVGGGLLLLCLQARAADIDVQPALDLQADAAEARQRQVPILVLFSSRYCGYCTIVREDFLKPMLKSGDYDDKVIIREADIEVGNDMIDFQGRLVDPEVFADSKGVYFTPTVKFFGPDGNETAEEIIGLLTVDFYGGYLDTAIKKSLEHLRGDAQQVARNK